MRATSASSRSWAPSCPSIVRGRGAAPWSDVACAQPHAWLHGVDRRFGTYRDDSETTRIDRGELAVACGERRRPLGARTAAPGCARRRAARSTAGRPAVLDPSAFVKGWALERGADLLQSEALTDICLSAGGERGGARRARCRAVLARRDPAPPLTGAAIATAIEVRDVAVATSRRLRARRQEVTPAATRAP
jgi:thiamine biosynthesis lipoprotein